MTDLVNLVDWSRAQFALTAMYHWLFVPLTLGLALTVAVMESIYVRTGSQKWLTLTKFWMTLFGINFALGVATGIILEFEFGSNWSNYSWFVGDIFGAPLAIEGLLAFFMEATFIAVMFFGWKKVSPRFHLTATWLTCIGASLSALWILVANAWMQYPVGMRFDPAQMRNVMDDFWAVALSPVALHKFWHSVMCGWTLAGIFVIGVSCWMLLRKRFQDEARSSIKVGAWVGGIGIVMTLWSGDGSAVDVARVQPMKLAAMEGLYRGSVGQEIVGFGILNPDKKPMDDKKPYLFDIAIPYGLSVLANHDAHSFVPGVDDLIDGRRITPEGDTIHVASYAERIERGKLAHQALRDFDAATAAGNKAAADSAAARLQHYYPDFGFGYLQKAEDAVPPVGLTFYSFRIMVMTGGYLLAFLALIFIAVYKAPRLLDKRWLQWLAIVSVPLVWICAEAGWVTAEVGRQPWIIQDIMPCSAAISAVSASSVQLTFWLFALVFTALLAAEACIMVHAIRRGPVDESSTSNDY